MSLPETNPNTISDSFEPTEDDVNHFMGQVYELHLDQPFAIDTGDGQPKQVLVEDAVYKHIKDENGQTVGKEPQLHLIDPVTAEGRYVNTADFLRWVHAAETRVDSESLAANKQDDVALTELVSTADENVMGGDTSDQSSELVDEIPNKNDSIVIAEAAERLHIPPGSTRAEIEHALESRITMLRKLATDMDSFEPTRRKVLQGIGETFNVGQNRLSGTARDGFSQYLQNEFSNLKNFVENQAHTLISDSTTDVKTLERLVKNLPAANEAMTARGRTWIDINAAEQVKRILDQFPRLSHIVTRELNAAQELYAQVSGFDAAQDLHEKMTDKNESPYRNERVSKWAQELESSTVTPDRVKEIEQEMFSTVNIESGMVDDPNSPRVWFGDRIIRDTEKSRREGVAYSGRVGASISSHQHVAEIMSDMLTGKFNVNAGNVLSPIELSADGSKVVSGQHRVAALAMLYGNNWKQIATQKGITY